MRETSGARGHWQKAAERRAKGAMSDAAGGFERSPACAALMAGWAVGGALSASSRRGEGVDEKKGSEARSA
eukprot:6028365-Pleurochrysis_carterae.AAC.1